MAKTKPLTTEQITAQACIKSLEHLASVFAQFECEEFNRTNQKLYEILAKVYEQYWALKKDSSLLRTVTKELANELKRKGQRIQTNSNILSLFVRMVFPNSRRQRIHNYARAIQVAYAENVLPENFVTFVTEQGGIEECCSQPKNDEKKDAVQIEKGLELYEDMMSSPNPTALACFKANPNLLTELNGSNIAVLLGKIDKDGNVTVVSVVPGYKKSVVEWAKERMALYLSKAVETTSLADKKANAADAIDAAVTVSQKIDLGTAKLGELEEA